LTSVGSTLGKTIWTVVPGANFEEFEEFFDKRGALPAGPPDLAKVAALFGAYSMELMPPV
jgi:hypothetical protein